MVKVTERSHHRPDHFDNVPPSVRDDCRWYVGTWKRFNLEDVGDCDLLRAAANLAVFADMERQLKRHHGGRFDKLVYATNLNAGYNALLSGISTSEHEFNVAYDDTWYETPDGYMYGVARGYFQPNRLLSFWTIKQRNKDKDPDFLRRYVTTGLVEKFEVLEKTGEPFEPQFRPGRA